MLNITISTASYVEAASRFSVEASRPGLNARAAPPPQPPRLNLRKWTMEGGLTLRKWTMEGGLNLRKWTMEEGLNLRKYTYVGGWLKPPEVEVPLQDLTYPPCV